MQIYTPEATRKLLKPSSDGCGFVLEYGGQTTGLVQPPLSWGPLDVQDVLRAIAVLNDRFPLGWLGDYPVFVTDLQYMYYDGKTWSDTGTAAKTYPQYVILCAQADYDEPRAAMTITHELGHVLMLKLMDTVFDGKETPKLAEYRRLRKLNSEIAYGWYWEDQIYEVLAEDFRWLFGSPMARLERFRTMDEVQDPKPPGEEIKRWFLGLLAGKKFPLKIEVVGEEEEKPVPKQPVVIKLTVGGKEIKRSDGKVFTMDVPARVEKGTTLVPLRAISEALGAFVYYDAKTKEITITLPA